MLPGKRYTPEDILRMVWRRKWIILLPTILIGAGTAIWSSFLPDRYLAETTIVVVPQRIPQTYVRSTVTAELGERLNTISQQILSRTRLERIIEEFNLYESQRRTMIMQDIVERMRIYDIKLNVAGGRRNQAGSFTVGFESSNPRTAVQVAERLASMFVQENLQEREVQADATSQFLQAQLEDARRRLIEHERKLESFRQQHAGRLPSQVASNMQSLNALQAELTANAESANRERDRLMVVESAIEQATTYGLDTGINAGTNWWLLAEGVLAAKQRASGGNRPDESGTQVQTTAQQLESARASLRGLELRLKPEHPDVKRLQRVIAELQVKADAEALAAPVPSEAAPREGGVMDAGLQKRVESFRLEAKELRAKIEGRRQEEERLKGLVAAYRARLEAAPALESALTELMRDYTTIQDQYLGLLRKSEESKLAVNLERRQIGEQFKIIDGARMPERPISPNRQQLNLIGVLSGLVLGVLLAGLLEYRDTTFKTDDDIVTSLALPVLAVIPLMVTTGERRRHRRRRLVLALSGSAVSLLLVASAVAWKLDLVPDWVR